jgi:hypothetical protein
LISNPRNFLDSCCRTTGVKPFWLSDPIVSDFQMLSDHCGRSS